MNVPLVLLSFNIYMYKQLNPESVNAVVLPDKRLHVFPNTRQCAMILNSNREDPDQIVRMSFIVVRRLITPSQNAIRAV